MTKTMTKTDTPKELVAKVVTISPEIAADWLGLNTRNRPFRSPQATDLARRLEAGEWMLNGDTVRFDVDGVLVDGQHRLTAIVMSNVTAPSLVVWNIPRDAFKTMDAGKKRNLGDALALTREVSCTTLAAAILLHWRVEHRSMVGQVTVPSTGAALEHLVANPGLREAVKVGERTAHKARCAPATLATAWYLFSKKDEEVATKFMTLLAEGAGLESHDPIFKLRERMISNREARLKISNGEMLALTIKAWNYWRVGRVVGNLSWRYRSGELFPDAQ